MKRVAGLFVVLAAVGGCVTTEKGPPWGGGANPGSCGTCGTHGAPPSVPGMMGPWGQPVAMAAPYSAAPPAGEAAARAMLARHMPIDLVQTAGVAPPPGAPSGIQRAGGPVPGAPMGGPVPGAPMGGPIPAPNLPPAQAISPPGVPFAPPVPGLPNMVPTGVVASVGALTGPTPNRFPTKRTEVRFAGPAGMNIAWFAPSPDGKQGFSSTQLEAPARYNFVQAALYRLKLSNIPNRPGLELYPTLEVVPSNAKTDPFLAHSAVPVVFTEEDFDQVAAGNFLVKVIYLPDPQFQDVATIGPDEVVSSRLEPGADPVAEAYRRGNILLIVRMGNIDLEAPNTPAMDAPSPYMLKPQVPPGLVGQAGAQQTPGGMPRPQMPMAGMPQMPGAPPGTTMTPYGPAVMTPNGPVLVTPNGPMMLTPNGPAPLSQEALGNMLRPPQAPGATPPAGGPVQGIPTGSQPQQQPAAPNTPVSQLPDVPVTRTQYPVTETAPGATSQTVAESQPTTVVQPKETRRWLFGGPSITTESSSSSPAPAVETKPSNGSRRWLFGK